MKAAILGGGQIGTRHAHNFARLGYAVAVYDPVPHRSTVRSATEALDGADLAVIATPPLSHVDGVLDALSAGVKWLLIEKPLTTTAKDGRALKEIIRSHKAHAYVGYCLRFALATIQLPEAIKAIEPVRLVARYSGPEPFDQQSWLLDPDQGGVVLEHSHMLDLLLHHFGMPIEIASLFNSRDVCNANLAWRDGLIGNLKMEFTSMGSPVNTILRLIGNGVATWRREWLSYGGTGLNPENPAAWLLHEAQELHTLRVGGAYNGRLCTLEEAIDVLDFAERL